MPFQRVELVMNFVDQTVRMINIRHEAITLETLNKMLINHANRSSASTSNLPQPWGRRPDKTLSVHAPPRMTPPAPGRKEDYATGMMVKLAKSPPELFPTHRPTRPFFRSFNTFTTRHGSFAPPTNTLAFGLIMTMRARNQAFGSGTGFTACSNFPGWSV